MHLPLICKRTGYYCTFFCLPYHLDHISRLLLIKFCTIVLQCPQCADGHSLEVLVRRRQVLCMSIEYDEQNRDAACNPDQKPPHSEACPHVPDCNPATEAPSKEINPTPTVVEKSEEAEEYSTPYWRVAEWSSVSAKCFGLIYARILLLR